VATADPYAAAKRPVRQAIARARERLVRRREALARAQQAARDAERWREFGEWVLAYTHAVEPGQAELLAETGQGAPLRIPLDPALSAVDNAQAYFARYRKAQRAAEKVPAQLRRVALDLDDLEQLAADLELAESRPEVEDVRAVLVDAGHVKSKKRRRRGVPRSEPLALALPGDARAWIGRNSRQNDEVTFRRGRADDWWFHARGVPGAHVIVRATGDVLEPAAVARAAELAAHFSSLRAEPYVDVDYTRRRYVRRIPGAAPGLVTYSEEQTLRVAPRGPEPGELGA
jgi:predicted ribosome quality control (RQC) complex YloA/Tae2 family protein